MPSPTNSTTTKTTASPLHAFDAIRRAYPGPSETVRDVEIDTDTQRLYVASCSNAVLVWHLTSRQPLAALKHPFWVNAVRRYPPLFPPWQPPAGTALDTSDTAAPRLSDHIILTACEDGVITAWNPETYKIADQVRPGFAAITALHVVSPCTSPATVPSTFGSRAKNDTLCFAASLEHVYVLQARPRLLVLQDLVHPGTCLTMHVASEPFLGDARATATTAANNNTNNTTTTAEPHAPLLVVGQEDGTMVCWATTRGTLQWDPIFGHRAPTEAPIDDAAHDPMRYKDTLLYPAGELDVEQDARTSSDIQKPGVNIATAQLKHTFDCNSRRLNPDETGPAPAVDAGVFERTMGLDSPAVKRTTQPEHVRYDRRRVTCLAGAPAAASSSASRFLSGHATGEILLWDTMVAPRQHKRTITVLLKKVRVFPSGAWVWNAVAMTLPTSWHDVSNTGQPTTKQPLPSLVKKPVANPASLSATQPSSPVFALCADSGEVAYMSCDETVRFSTGPGFLFTGGGFCCAPTSAKERWPSVHVILGTFDGRLEALDVTAAVKRLRPSPDAG